MSAISLRTKILNYLKSQDRLVNGGEIERLALESGYKASNASRRLRELHEEGLVESNYDRDRKHTVWYRIKNQESKQLTIEI